MLKFKDIYDQNKCFTVIKLSNLFQFWIDNVYLNF